jgi:hypothetical protein
MGYLEIAYDSGTEPETTTITLDPTEAQFLVTVLESSAAILTAVMALERSLPGLSSPPIGTDAIPAPAFLSRKVVPSIATRLAGERDGMESPELFSGLNVMAGEQGTAELITEGIVHAQQDFVFDEDCSQLEEGHSVPAGAGDC